MAAHSRDCDLAFLHRAALAALRGRGHVEPNPLVGCVLVDRHGQLVSIGHHRRHGGHHAEVEAIQTAGERARGSTMYVTLEPCAHQGKTPPCTDAILQAGIARVIVAQADPNPTAQGGAGRLLASGVSVKFNAGCDLANDVSAPFRHRVTTGLPWVIAKWAQTLDGRVAARSGDSRWISSAASRRMVHAERGRVDAILTGIGTVLADDPMLTARHVGARRIARRVVVDPELRTPAAAAIVRTAREVPTFIACDRASLESRPTEASALERAGVELIPLPVEAGSLSLDSLLRELVFRHGVATVLVEAGPGLSGRLIRARLVNEIVAFVAPAILGDAEAVPAVRGSAIETIADSTRLFPRSARYRSGDMILRYAFT